MPIAIVIAQLLLQYGPALAGEFVTLFHSDKEPTAADWHALLAKASKKSFDDYMNEATAPANPVPPTA